MPKACVPHDGYRFEDGGRFVRKKSMDKLKDKIREKTKRTCGQSLRVVIADLNGTSCGTHACRQSALPSPRHALLYHAFSALDRFAQGGIGKPLLARPKVRVLKIRTASP